MPIQRTKELLAMKPIHLGETAEHRVLTRKWWAVSLLLIGGLILSTRPPISPAIPYALFFFGHGGMLHSFWDKKDIPMVIVNGVWLLIDVVGFIRWM